MTSSSPMKALCQPDAKKSCGACCGLYNYVDSTRESLTLRLHDRTRRFRQTVNSPADLARFAEVTLQTEDFRKRFSGIYCCEYLGFVNAEETRVGCLLHPLVNDGLDMRDVSFYGRVTCANHLCPSHHFIPAAQTQILIDIIDDWYLFGLCLTDIDLVTTYFRLIADRVGREIKPDVFRHDGLKALVLEYLGWKITWPFRSEEANRLGKYYFDGSQYMISHIDYEKFGLEISPFNTLFLSLSSVFASRRDVESAQEMIQKNIDSFVLLYRSHFDFD